MKKNLLLILISFCVKLNAQTIPNAGFETWQNYNAEYPVEGPQHWWNIDLIASAFNASYTPYSALKTTQSHSGTYAALMKTNISGGDTISGALFSSDSVGFFGNTQGFSINSRPASLTGFYKFTSAGGDIAEVLVFFTKWNNGHRDTLAKPVYSISTNISSYTQFSIPITYSFASIPDTAYIATGIEGPGGIGNTHVGTEFYLDDLAFSGSVPVGIKEYSKDQNLVTVFPNPFSTKAEIRLDASVDPKTTILIIYDAQGKEVKHFAQLDSNQLEMDRKGLTNGIYFYKLLIADGSIAKGKLIIE